jgi:hypothetical protein
MPGGPRGLTACAYCLRLVPRWHRPGRMASLR